MDCIQSIQKALDFMEENILESINYEDVARQVYMSNYHFHRLFSMITGITANEYIRNRRLSMAGQDLNMSGEKVVDIALKYGYETPEGFTKAFSRFHGVSPIVAKNSGVQLKSFSRLVIEIQLKGGKIMDYKIIEKESFQLLTRVKAFKNEITSEKGNTEIADFWTECIDNGVLDILNKYCINHDLYGVCATTSKESTEFDYGIGMVYEGGKIPAGFRVWGVKATLWAVFKCIGTDGDCIDETWNKIFKEFLPNSDYTMLDDTDLELYSTDDADCFCEIWIPVVKKN